MARPERLELPTYWFEAMNPREISILALGTTVTHDSSRLLVGNGLRHPESARLAVVSNASMQGAGTIMGTAKWGTRDLLHVNYPGQLFGVGQV